jgi:hypothetical protein
MDKLIKMTKSEMRAETAKNRKAIITRAKTAPEAESLPFKPGPVVARGFAAFKEHINRNSRPKVKDKKVMIGICLPESKVAELQTNVRYSSYIADYVMKGLDSGALKIPNQSRKRV